MFQKGESQCLSLSLPYLALCLLTSTYMVYRLVLAIDGEVTKSRLGPGRRFRRSELALLHNTSRDD
jgi:hypothetical protein